MEEKFYILINQTKKLISQRNFNECEAVICTSMFENPHDAVPHNLMGLMLEAQGCHAEAMKHFRAAKALDPTYKPVDWNLNCYGAFYRKNTPAFCNSDCELQQNEEEGRDKKCI